MPLNGAELIDPRWIAPATLKEATAIQREIAGACEAIDRLAALPRVAGADVSMAWRDARGPVYAAIAPMAADGARLPPATARVLPRFPYVPGYLGFREVPALLAAWDALDERPELLLVDGHGRAHPRRCGVATHIGVVLDVPTIGVAKSLLCGVIEGEVGPNAGDRAAVVDRGETVAMALRLRPRAAPVFVGIGHRISLESAVETVLRLSDGRRLPPPIRTAHDAANAARRADLTPLD